MGLIAPGDQQKLRDAFAEMTRPVHLLFFTQTLGPETCLQTRQILDELPPLSDRIIVDEVNFVLDTDTVQRYGIDRVPSIAVAFEEDGVLHDSRIRFAGTPGGYEFVSLVQAALLAGGREATLGAESRTLLAALDRPITMRVFTTPTCPHCPRAVTMAHEMAFLSPHVTAWAVEATEFPDLARQYQVTGVPKTVVNDDVEILGAVPEQEFVADALRLP